MMRRFKFLFGFYKTARANFFLKSMFKKKIGLFRRVLISKLFRKLDVCLVRFGFVNTIYAAKEFIRNGFVIKNGSTVKSSSVILNKGDVIQLHPSTHRKVLHNLRFRALGFMIARRKHFRNRNKRRKRFKFKPCVYFRSFSQFEINYNLLTVVVVQNILSNSDSVLSFPYQLAWQHLPSR